MALINEPQAPLDSGHYLGLPRANKHFPPYKQASRSKKLEPLSQLKKDLTKQRDILRHGRQKGKMDISKVLNIHQK